MIQLSSKVFCGVFWSPGPFFFKRERGRRKLCASMYSVQLAGKSVIYMYTDSHCSYMDRFKQNFAAVSLRFKMNLPVL